MKRSIGLLAVALTVLLLGFTTPASAQSSPRQGTVIIPESSIEHPEDIGVRAHTNIEIFVPDGGDYYSGENPSSIACVYKLVTQTKGCQTNNSNFPSSVGAKAIALVDAFNNPDATTDINTFASYFGLPTPNFSVVEVGSPSNDQGWALEESLDIEYAFAQAPDAQIYLVEANSNSFSDLLAAEDKATKLLQAAGGGEASNSWGGSDGSGESSYDSHFKGKGVVYFASSGDTGGEVIYPSASPFVVSAGGTQFNRDSSGNFVSETGWYDGGGGKSCCEKRPSYQNIVKKIVGTQRGTPDLGSLAVDALIYSEYGCGGWCDVDGTSISSPTLAGIVNSAGTFNTSTKAQNTEMYNEYGNSKEYKADFTDITKGGYDNDCTKGYDFCSGIGSVLTYTGK